MCYPVELRSGRIYGQLSHIRIVIRQAQSGLRRWPQVMQDRGLNVT